MGDDSTMPEMKSAALVLDWNGTVVDDLDRAVNATNDVLLAMGRPTLDVDTFCARFTLPLTRFFAAISVPAGEVAAATELWNQCLRRSPARLSEGVPVLMDQCRRRDIEIVILSAAQEEVVTDDATALGLTPLLARVIAPSVDKCRDLVDLRRSYPQLAFVGDTDSDIKAARDAGVTAIGYTKGYHRPEQLAAAGADFMISDMGRILTSWGGPEPGRTRHPPALELTATTLDQDRAHQ